MKDNRFNLPIPYGWYCVGYSDDLADGDVLPVRYFASDLVLFRTHDGQAKLCSAYCPHLGAHLGHGGKVTDTGIACPFHGWEFNTQGEVASVPYASQIPPKAQNTRCLTVYPVHEQNNFIFAWYHPDNIDPLFDVEPFEELDSGDWADCESRQWAIHTHIQESGENGVDTAHFPTVHNTGDMMSRVEVTFDGHKRISIIPVSHQRVDCDGPIAEKDTDTVDGTMRSANIGPGQSWTRNYGIDILMIGLPTPVETDIMELRFACSVPKKNASANADITRLIYDNAFEQIEQDIPIWENKIYQPDPILCDGDGPIARYRRWFQQFYSRQ